ncbi:MAG: tetratricopeptide repeat protein [Planctomycetes bacterium]|nr:tetratricopeptide repeat protein [Planctomycetota bacterium]
MTNKIFILCVLCASAAIITGCGIPPPLAAENPYLAGAKEYETSGDYDKAINEYTLAIGHDINNALLYQCRGDAYAKKGHDDLAISDYTRAIALHPEFYFAYYSRGICYRNKKDYDSAIADQSRALELKPDFAQSYCERGWSYHAKCSYDMAMDDFRKALELDPHNNKAQKTKDTLEKMIKTSDPQE